MNILENKSSFKIEDMLSITERDGNKKRPYLLLNKLQAKYLPVNPSISLKLFDELAYQLDINISDKNILVIGFAETATAIGARVAEIFSKKFEANVDFLPTTREVYNYNVIEFQEEHSHAVEQLLYIENIDLDFYDYIAFIEDEVTTGNTIVNCVKQLDLNCNYLVLSILNCMSKDELLRFENYNIKPYWLVKSDKEDLEKLDKNESVNEIILDVEPKINKLKYTISNPRLGVSIDTYSVKCNSLLSNIKYIEGLKEYSNILVLGTEECMYPAIIFANDLNRLGFVNTVVSATTRVPSCTNKNNDDYPLKTRTKIKSFYGDRNTYIYNIKKYDFVVIITDGKEDSKELYSALFNKGCTNIYVINIGE